MLSSTRASALAYNLAHRALPAESSRQGLLRAIAQQRAAVQSSMLNGQKRTIHRRSGSSYATAVAYEENERADIEEYEDWRIAARGRERRYPEPRPPDTVMTELAADRTGVEDSRIVQEEVPSLDGLKVVMRSEPVRALHLLPRYSLSDLSKLSARDLTAFVKDLYQPFRNDSAGHYLASIGHYEWERSLVVLRGLLHDLPTTPEMGDRHLGRQFKGKGLGRFLRLCVALECDSVLRSTIQERLEAQKIEGKVLVNPDIWANDLANRQKWNLIIDLLSPSRLPIDSFTPGTIFRLMQAHIGIGEIVKVPLLFRLYAELSLEPAPRAYSLLVQAQLVLGDLDAARQVMQESLSVSKTDDVSTQLAILKGYRELGRDVAMEDRVLEASKGMRIQDQAAMLNALIRLRMDGRDEAGARELLGRFDCDFWLGLSEEGITDTDLRTKLPANAQTHYLGFRMMAPAMTREQLEKAWEYLQVNSVPITDQFARILFDTLVRLDHFEEARRIISGKSTSSITLPETYQPGPVILNTLLEHSGKIEGWKGLQNTLKTFRTSRIQPDAQTLSIVLRYVRDNVTRDPTVLANLTNSILRQSPNIKPTVDHMDFLLGQAVRAHARSNQIAASSKSTPDTQFDASDATSTTPEAGLQARDPFAYSVRSIIKSLSVRGVRSMSRSLATRLRFDAQNHSSGTGMTSGPSVRAVWDDLIARGYQPDKTHFLALMKGYADSGNMVECEDVILLAKDMGVERTRGMWMVLMTSYGRFGSPQFSLRKAEKAFQAIQRSEQGLDLPAVCAMIGIYERCGARHNAAELALRLVSNLAEPSESDTVDQTPFESKSRDSWVIPTFPRSEFTDQSLVITTHALRLEHPFLALQVISTIYPTRLPTRVRHVVTSIRNRARARISRSIDDSADHELLAFSERMLAKQPIGGRRKIGAEGLKRRIRRLFNNKPRGNGGRRFISAKEERRERHQASLAQRNVGPEAL